MGNIRHSRVWEAFKACVKGCLISQQTSWYRRGNEAHTEVMNVINTKEIVDKNDLKEEGKKNLCILRNKPQLVNVRVASEMLSRGRQ